MNKDVAVPDGGSVKRLSMDKTQKKYRVNVKKRSKIELPKEQEIIEDTVVVLKVAHYPNTKIAQIVGISRGQVAEILKDPKVEKRVTLIAAQLPQAALSQLQSYMIEAVQWYVHIGRMNLREGGDHQLVLRAADAILDRGGAPKTSRQERKDEGGESPLTAIGRGGREDAFEMVRNLPPELQERAASLYDALEDGLKAIVSEAGGKDAEQAEK